MKMSAEKRALDKVYKRRDRYEIPDWQRQPVWGPSKKRKLIDTILRGWRLPKFYFLKTASNPDEFEVVDGQQRLEAIFDFFDNELTLSAEGEAEFGGATYGDLPDHYSDAFDDFEIEYDEIEAANEDELKEFFQRLQQGLPLTSSERLNATHSKLRDFAKNLAKHEFLAKRIQVQDHRYAHFDIVVKVAAIEIDGIEVGLRYDDLASVFDANNNFSSVSNVAKRLKTSLDFLKTAFPEKEKRLRNRAVVQSVATLANALVRGGNEKGFEGQFGKFVAHFLSELASQVELGANALDPDYLAFQRTVSANVKTGARTRHEILLKKLFSFDPTAVDRFSSEQIAASGLADQVASVADDVTDLVARINDLYSADTGVNMFKPTNKTVAAQKTIRIAITDTATYKGLIEALYFLFWEGPGAKLQGNEPPSFKHVNELRTSLEHDVDHGKAKKVKAKQKKLGSTFATYAGPGTPDTVGPERFLVLHASLLSAIQRDLRGLLATL